MKITFILLSIVAVQLISNGVRSTKSVGEPFCLLYFTARLEISSTTKLVHSISASFADARMILVSESELIQLCLSGGSQTTQTWSDGWRKSSWTPPPSLSSWTSPSIDYDIATSDISRTDWSDDDGDPHNNGHNRFALISSVTRHLFELQLNHNLQTTINALVSFKQLTLNHKKKCRKNQNWFRYAQTAL